MKVGVLHVATAVFTFFVITLTNEFQCQKDVLGLRILFQEPVDQTLTWGCLFVLILRQLSIHSDVK